jgi:exodeoxyribonuclease VII small subunit
MSENQDKQDLTFEKAMLALESITEQMAKESLDLDKMIELYEQGIGYLQICQGYLEKAEIKIQMLNERIKQGEETDNG